MSSWWECPVCREDYSPETQGDHAPISGVCGHTICRQCVTTVHKKSLEGRSRVHHLECPECLDTTFDAQNVSPNILICQILTERHEAVGGTVTEENDGTVKEENDDTVKEENDKEFTRRRDRSTRIGNQDAVATVTPNRPVSATRDISPPTAEAALSGPVTPNRKRQKLSVQVTPELRNRPCDPAAIKTELEETDESSSTDQPSEPLWYESIQASRPRRVFRVRQCKKDAASPTDDKYGQKPSWWALKAGYVLTAARAIPHDIETSEAAKDFLQDTAQVVAFCQDRSTFSEHTHSIKLYVNGYKNFCEMQKGDIVVLHVCGGTGQGLAHFGVVESDEITIWSHAKLLAKGFPSPTLTRMCERNIAWKDKRVMLRRIKWMREGLVRELPDQSTGRRNANHVPWLGETEPFWMANVTEKGALARVSMAEFMECTSVTKPELIQL